MVVSDIRDDHRGAWRSPSRDMAEPIAARKCKIIYYTHFQHRKQKMFSGFAPLVRLHLAERLQVNLHLARWHELCSYLQLFAFRRGAKFRFRKFAHENSER